MKLDMTKLETLPGLVGQMMKPAEKIDSIRINHITGMGGSSSGGGSSGATAGPGGEGPVVNQVVDGVLSMALQLPAVKKLGEEVGLNIADGVSGLSRSVSDEEPGTFYLTDFLARTS